MGHELQRQRNFLAALLVVGLLGIAMPAGASGAGGAGGSGGAGGGGGEDIGVAQEADDGCCCPVTLVEGTPVKCYTTSTGSCNPYYSYSVGACNNTTPVPTDGGTGACSASGVRSGTGAMDAVEMFGLLLMLAAFRAMRRRFVW